MDLVLVLIISSVRVSDLVTGVRTGEGEGVRLFYRELSVTGVSSECNIK